MNLMFICIFLAAAIAFAAFSWGVKGHFRSTGAMPAGMKLTSAISLAFFLLFALRLWLIPAGGLIPIALFAAALAVFGWAIGATRETPPTLAFDTDSPSFLLRHGPYRYVRHPFYLAYLMFWTGTAAATGGTIGWAVPLVMLGLYTHAASREEQKFAGSSLAGAYAAYRGEAGMFLPRMG